MMQKSFSFTSLLLEKAAENLSALKIKLKTLFGQKIEAMQ